MGGVNYPLLSDDQKIVSRAYDVLDESEGVCLRATFIINPSGDVSYLVVSHTNVGRSVEEPLLGYLIGLVVQYFFPDVSIPV